MKGVRGHLDGEEGTVFGASDGRPRSKGFPRPAVLSQAVYWPRPAALVSVDGMKYGIGAGATVAWGSRGSHL
eukprot:797228-Lingulodinium_polyedra.AAC.1